MYDIPVRTLLGHRLKAVEAFFSNQHSQSIQSRANSHTCLLRLESWRISLLFMMLCCFLPAGCGFHGAISSLVASPADVSFGLVPVGQTASTTVSIINQSSTAVEVSKLNVTGQSFSLSPQSNVPATLAAGSSLSLNVQFSPVAAGGTTGQLTITSNSPASPTLVVSLSGTGTTTPAGGLSALALSCTKSSMAGAGTDACTVTLSTAAGSGGLTVSLSSSSTAVAVPASVTVPANATSAAFTATVASVSSAQTVTLTATAGSASTNFTLQLNAPTPILTINATTVGFGDVTVNTSSTQSLTLTSAGGEPVTISAASVTGTGFTMSGLTLPLTLNPGQTATLNILFDPASAGVFAGQLTITSNSSSNGNVVIPLSGTGTAVSQHEVDLSWNAPASSPDPVAGYHVYRSTDGGSSYQLLNSTGNTQTTYVDSAVQSGSVYEYIVESVDSLGVESVPSNTATATVP